MDSGKIIEAFAQLIPKHRKYLFEKYTLVLAKRPKARTASEKYVRIASELGNDAIAQYKTLYPRKEPRFSALYTPKSAEHDPEWILNRLRDRFTSTAIPRSPHLTADSPPTFNGLRTYSDGSLELDFVSLSAEKTKLVDYGTPKTWRDIKHDKVLVGAGTSVIEISARTPEHRDDVLKAFCKALDLQKSDFSRRAFDKPEHWQKLQNALLADVNGHGGNKRRKGEPVAYAMHARRGERLDDLPKWKSLGINHYEARELTFFFRLDCSIDGFPEEPYYYIKLATGEIKFPEDISEVARRKVINEYLKIV